MRYVLVILLITSNALADGPYYVRPINDCTGAPCGISDGSDWDNAYDGFGDIVWATVAAGSNRVIYISGGSTTKTYTESWSPGASGTDGNPITITVGIDEGHNGTAILTSSGSYVINLSSDNHITIDGQSGGDGQRHIEINLPDTINGKGIYSTSSTSVGLIVKYVTFEDINGHDAFCIMLSLDSVAYAVGHEFSYNSFDRVYQPFTMSVANGGSKPSSFGGVKIHHNTMQFYDDGVEGCLGSLDIYENTFRLISGETPGHPDGFQLCGSWIRAWNNTFYDFDAVSGYGNSNISWVPDDDRNLITGTDDYNENAPCCFWAWNNLIYMTDGSHNTDGLELGLNYYTDFEYTVSDLYIFNNTVVITNDAGYCIYLDFSGADFDKADVQDVYIENNIFVSDSSSKIGFYLSPPASYDATPVDYGSHGDSVSVVIDYNLYHGTGAVNVNHDGTPTLYETWKTATGCQDHDETSDPSLDANYKPDAADDPVVGAGVDLSSYFTTDKDGNTRTDWDIGAYEYVPPSGASYVGGAMGRP